MSTDGKGGTGGRPEGPRGQGCHALWCWASGSHGLPLLCCALPVCHHLGTRFLSFEVNTSGPSPLWICPSVSNYKQIPYYVIFRISVS